MDKTLPNPLVLMSLLVVLAVWGKAEACSCSSTSCDCRSLLLTSVPQDLPTTITDLDLRFNQIRTLHQSDFSRYRSLETLDLESNPIFTINSQVFCHLLNLTELELSGNSLTTLRSDMFTGLGNLQTLGLDNNPINDIQTGTFNTTPQLTRLTMWWHRLTILRAGMFTGLGNLQHLSLAGNYIRDIQAGTFNSTRQLTFLTLRFNKLTRLSHDMFEGLENLRILYLHDNEINDIQTGTFYATPRVTSLVLSRNKLTILRSDMFTGLGGPRLGLNLDENGINDIPAGTFNAIPQMASLKLSKNKLTVLRSDMFTGLQNLNWLYLEDNEIGSVQPGTFNPTPQLMYLHLHNNHIQTIPCNLLVNLSGLRNLRLSNNIIKLFPFEGLSRMQRLVRLYLHNNQLGTLPVMAYGILSSISEVNIENNPWQCDCTWVPFRLRMTGSHAFEHQINCSQPSNFYGQKLIDINPENLVCEEPTIARFQRIENIPLLQGKPIHLVCEASGSPTPDITVILPSGLNVTVLSDGRVTVDMTGSIIIENATVSDAGLYTCIAASPVGSASAKLSIDVIYEEPSIVRFESSANKLVEGEIFLLACEASGIPTPDITVVLPSGLNVTAQSGGRVTMTINGTITVRDTTVADAGLYVCIAASPAGSEFSTLFVDSFDQEPVILNFKRSENNALVEGGTLRLVCEASGIPTPDITVILPSGLNTTVLSHGKVSLDMNGTITIENVTATDAGLHACIAVNSAGSTFATLVLEVQTLPTTVSMPLVTSPPSIIVTTNSPESTTELDSAMTTSNSPQSNTYPESTPSISPLVSVVSSPSKQLFSSSGFVSSLEPAPSFSLPILLGAICGSIAGTLLIVGLILTIWCRRNTKRPPKGSDFSVVFNNTNTTTTVITNSQSGYPQTMSESSNETNSRPASSQFEPYEDVVPPPSNPKPRAAVPSQPAPRQAPRPPKRNNTPHNDPPPLPPLRTANPVVYENIPEHAYQSLTTTRNPPNINNVSPNHYQSLTVARDQHNHDSPNHYQSLRRT
ncbi:uncharacterized protein LOC144860925 [Branchiostoma floridae x Branchiostoma japonicum]